MLVVYLNSLFMPSFVRDWSSTFSFHLSTLVSLMKSSCLESVFLKTLEPRLMVLNCVSRHKIVKNHPQIFRKDPCTHARISSQQNARAHVYASCARVYARIFPKNHLIILYYLMNQSLKFYKDRCFRSGDICKTILTFVYS